MAFKRLFDDKFIGDVNRRSDYTKWSERAIVVGYNGDTQTYDIVITTERLAGVSKRTLNKTIRNVKSTIPASSLTFSPGDAVLIGYVSDQREHPIIIGGGGNVVQEAAIVTIGGATSENEIEGGGSEFETEEGFAPGTPFIVFDSITGSTQSYTLDCALLAGDSFFLHEVNVTGGIGVVSFTLSGEPQQCELVTQKISGVIGRFRMKPPPTVGVGRTAYLQMTHIISCTQALSSFWLGQLDTTGFCIAGPTPPLIQNCAGVAGFVSCCVERFEDPPTAPSGRRSELAYRCRDCDDTLNKPGPCGTGGSFQGPDANIPIAQDGILTAQVGACGSDGPSIVRSAPLVPPPPGEGSIVCLPFADISVQPPFVPGLTPDSLEYLDAHPGVGESCDIRIQTDLDSGTCCPCHMFAGTIITATDSAGRSFSLIMQGDESV